MLFLNFGFFAFRLIDEIRKSLQSGKVNRLLNIRRRLRGCALSARKRHYQSLQEAEIEECSVENEFDFQTRCYQDNFHIPDFVDLPSGLQHLSALLKAENFACEDRRSQIYHLLELFDQLLLIFFHFCLPALNCSNGGYGVYGVEETDDWLESLRLQVERQCLSSARDTAA